MLINRSFSDLTIFIPLPPPPAEAFIIIGKPIFSEFLSISALLFFSMLKPGTIGTLDSPIMVFALDFRAIALIDEGLGPIKIKFLFNTSFAKSAFSERKPYPG